MRHERAHAGPQADREDGEPLHRRRVWLVQDATARLSELRDGVPRWRSWCRSSWCHKGVPACFKGCAPFSQGFAPRPYSRLDMPLPACKGRHGRPRRIVTENVPACFGYQCRLRTAHAPHSIVLAWLNTVQDDNRCLCLVTIGELQDGVEIVRAQDKTKADEIER